MAAVAEDPGAVPATAHVRYHPCGGVCVASQGAGKTPCTRLAAFRPPSAAANKLESWIGRRLAGRSTSVGSRNQRV